MSEAGVDASGHTDLVAEIRRLIEVVRTADMHAAEGGGVSLADAGQKLAQLRTQLEPFVIHGERAQAMLHTEEGEGTGPGELPHIMAGGDPQAFFPYSPLIGRLNPIAPPFTLATVGQEIHGHGRFGSAYNGPPAGVHGGHVAALLDEVLGATGVVTGNHGFTGTLTVRYESLTPLDTDLTVRGWIDRVDGRKTWIQGELLHGETRCAFAEGLFIRPAAA